MSRLPEARYSVAGVFVRGYAFGGILVGMGLLYVGLLLDAALWLAIGVCLAELGNGYGPFPRKAAPHPDSGSKP